MFTFNADKNNLTVTGNDLLTSGSVNVNKFVFKFSSDWDGLVKKAIFSSLIDNKNRAYEMVVEDDIEYFIPWELYVSKDNTIYVGVYGIKDEEIVLPTEKKRVGIVKDSVLDPNAIPVVPWDPDEDPNPPTTTGDHRRLTHRDDPDQHPIKSIAGLEQTVTNIATTPISNTELEAMLT